MPDNTPSDDETFNEAYAIMAEKQRPLDARVQDVVEQVDGTSVSAKDVLIAFAVTLRNKDPLDGNNRRVSTLLTTAERYDIDISLEEIIDAGISGDTGPKYASSATPSHEGYNFNITDRSDHQDDDAGVDGITYDIDFNDDDAVKNAAVSIYNSDDLSHQEKRSHLKSLLEQAADHGVSIKPSDIRGVIKDHRKHTNGDSDNDQTDVSDSASEGDSAAEKNGDDTSEQPEPKPAEAKLSIVDTTVSSTGIHAGESVRVTVTVKNDGQSIGLKDIQASKNHDVVKKDSVTVEPGETATKSFEIPFTDGGQHLIQINDNEPVSITVLTPAEITVTDIETESTQVPPDENIPITVTVENTGDLSGETELDLVVGEHLFESRTISIDGNTSHEEVFDIELDRPGEYTVSVGTEELTLTALRPASVNVTDYRLSSTGLELGEELTVNVDIENTGDLSGTIAVALYSNNSTIETKSVEIAGNDTKTINFTTSFDRTGSHAITINNIEPTEITVLKPASATVREFTINNTSLTPSETLGVATKIDNTGDLSDTKTLNVSVNGDVIHTESIQIPGNQAKTVTIGSGGDIDVDFSAVLDTPGEYSISINGLSPTTVTVLEPADVNVRYYSLSSDNVVPGEEFEVNVEIENTGDVAGETNIEIYIDGELTETQTVSVDGNSDKRGTFEQTLSEPGTYSIVVNDLEPSEITVRGTGEFNITDISVESPSDTIYVGDTLKIAVSAENTTELNSEQTLTTYLGGVEVASDTFELAKNTEETFILSVEPQQTGIYNLEINDKSVKTLKIEPEKEVVDLTNEAYVASVTRCIIEDTDGNRCANEAEEHSVLCDSHASEENALKSIVVEHIENCQYTTPDGTKCDHNAEHGGVLCTEHNPLEQTFGNESIDDSDTDTDADWGEPLENSDSDTQTESEPTTEPTDGDSTEDTTESDQDTLDEDTHSDYNTEQTPTEQTDPVNDTDKTQPSDDGHTRTLNQPNDTDGKFGQSTNTRTTVKFDFVLDNDEDILPNDVDGAGMIVDDDEYIGIAEVHPRSWSIHTPEEKQQIINQYRTMFLGSLDFPVQIVCYPTEFDISEHITALEDRTRTENIRDDESYLLNIGREIYPNWLRKYIAQVQMKQRNFYIIVRVKPEQLNRFRQADTGAIDTIERRAPAIANILRKVVPGADNDSQTQDVTRKDCLMELHDRLQRLESALNPMGVNVDPIRSRDKAMTVLYQYYNNEHPIVDNFDMATRSEYAPTMEIDENNWPMDGLTDIHYEEFNTSGGTQ